MFYNVPPFLPGRPLVHISVPPGCRPAKSENVVVHRVRLQPRSSTSVS